MTSTNDRVGLNRDLALNLRNQYHLKTFIETGTYRGESAFWAAGEFDQVITIESDEKRWRRVHQAAAALPNLLALHGDSRVELPRVLKKIKEPALFWLDAHLAGYTKQGWINNDQCPLVDELKAVRDCGVKHVVLIDDANWFIGKPDFEHDPAQFPRLEEIRALLPGYVIPKYVGWNTLVCLPEAGK